MMLLATQTAFGRLLCPSFTFSRDLAPVRTLNRARVTRTDVAFTFFRAAQRQRESCTIGH